MNDWETTLAAVLRRQWKRYRRALERCQRRFSEKSVHASRVETRRLLAQIELFSLFIAKRPLKKARRVLKLHLDTFDTLRDTQMLMLLLSKQLRAFPEAGPFHDALVRREKRGLKTAIRRIRSLKTTRLRNVVRSLADQLRLRRKNPEFRAKDRKAILSAVDAAFARVVERRQQVDPGQVGTLHRVRVAFKKFRYIVEALQPLFAEISRQRLAAMHSYQGLLGDLQDTDVFLARLDKFTRQHPARAKVLAGLRHWLLRRRTAQIQHCLERADDLFTFWPLTTAGRSPPRTARAKTR